MFIRAGYKIINTDNIIDIDEYPAHDGGVDEDEEPYPAQPLRLFLHTAAPSFGMFGYDASTPGTDHRQIILVGDPAEEFLGALPVVSIHGVEPVV